MRLSEVKGERVFDVIANVTEHAHNIVCNESVSRLLGMFDEPEGEDAYERFAKSLLGILPTVIRECKDDAIAIMCEVGDVSREEYLADMTLKSFMEDVRELLTDDAFADFFALSRLRREESPSTSA